MRWLTDLKKPSHPSQRDQEAISLWRDWGEHAYGLDPLAQHPAHRPTEGQYLQHCQRLARLLPIPGLTALAVDAIAQAVGNPYGNNPPLEWLANHMGEDPDYYRSALPELIAEALTRLSPLQQRLWQVHEADLRPLAIWRYSTLL